MKKVAVVTGGSSGIGRCTALALAARGCRVYELSRSGTGEPGITHITADVTDEASVRAALSQVLESESRLDILVNNAGYGISGAVEFTPAAQARAQLEVNFFGTDNCVRSVLPIMRKQGAGRIICLSSVAGAIPIPFQTYYSVSKAAIRSYCTALRSEVAPFGISVCAVLPGDICTGFTDARNKLIEGDDVYGGRIARSVAVMERDERGGIPPEKAGTRVAALALKKNVKPICGLGAKYRCFLVLYRLLPCRFSTWLVGKLYGG